ncbi:hypothetical protein FPV67DRAFT_1497824 [Lyophyllum atratum]|nr:hypothetical protein FPV67DRAFT_1497824 [Lyophyllum atratum]
MSNILQKSMVLGEVENAAERLRRKELRSLRAVAQLSGIFSVVPRYMPHDILNGEYESGEDEPRDALGVKGGDEGGVQPEDSEEQQDDKDGLDGKHVCEAEDEEEEGESDGGSLHGGTEDEDDYEDEDGEAGGSDGAENDESTDDEVDEEQPVIEIPRPEFIQAWNRLNFRPTRVAWRRQFTGTCFVCSRNGLRCDFSTPSDGARPRLACTGCYEAKQACSVKAHFALFDMPKNLNLTTNFVRWALKNNWQVQPRAPRRKTLSVEKRPLLEPERSNSKASKSKPGPGVNSAGKVDGKVKEVRGDVSGGRVSRAGWKSKGRVAGTAQLSGGAKLRPKVTEHSKARAAGRVVHSQSKDAIDGVSCFHDAAPSQHPLPSDSPQPPSPVPGPVPPTEHTSTLSMERDEITTRNNLDVMLANAANSQRQKTISILFKQVDRLREDRNTLRRSNETISLELTGVRGQLDQALLTIDAHQNLEKDRVALPVVASSDERSADDVTQLKGELAISQDPVKDLENQLAASVASVDILKEDSRKWKLRAEEGTEMTKWKGRAMTTMEEVLGLELDRARLRLAVQNPVDKIYGLLERPSDGTLPAISGAIADIRCALSRDAVTDTRQLLEGRNPSWLYDPYSRRSVVRRGDHGYSDVEIERFLERQDVHGAGTESIMSPYASRKRAAVPDEDDDDIPGPSKRARTD